MWTTGHSRGVADLAERAAGVAGLAAAQVVALRRAALVHDIGRVAVPVSVWAKPGPLSRGEYEQVRLHAYHSERVLDACPALRPLGHSRHALHAFAVLDGADAVITDYRREEPTMAKNAAPAAIWCATRSGDGWNTICEFDRSFRLMPLTMKFTVSSRWPAVLMASEPWPTA